MILEVLAAVDPSGTDVGDVLARKGGGKGFKVSAPLILIVIAAVIGVIVRFAWARREQIAGFLNSLNSGTPGSRSTPPSPADVRAAMDPTTPPQTLAHMVNNAPPLRPYVASNPAAEPDLLRYLGTLGDPAINQALNARGVGNPTTHPGMNAPVSAPSMVKPPPPSGPTPLPRQPVGAPGQVYPSAPVHVRPPTGPMPGNAPPYQAGPYPPGPPPPGYRGPAGPPAGHPQWNPGPPRP